MVRDTMNEPFISNPAIDSVQIHTGKPGNMVPFLAVGHYKGKVVFQIPGGSPLEVSQKVAFQFIQRLIDISYEAGEELREMEAVGEE